MIFECGPDGADLQVCRHLARLLHPVIEIVHVTLDNKPKLATECGTAAAKLLAEGCERIVIIWDLHPPWRSNRQKPCRKEDRETIFVLSPELESMRLQVSLVLYRGRVRSMVNCRWASAVLSAFASSAPS